MKNQITNKLIYVYRGEIRQISINISRVLDSRETQILGSIAIFIENYESFKGKIIRRYENISSKFYVSEVMTKKGIKVDK